MKITFRIQYHTVWEKACACFSSQNHIQHTIRNDYPQRKNGPERRIRLSPFEPICYRYAVSHQGAPSAPGIWRHPHSFYRATCSSAYLVEDCWRICYKMPTAIHRLSTVHTPEQPSLVWQPAGASPSAHSWPEYPRTASGPTGSQNLAVIPPASRSEVQLQRMAIWRHRMPQNILEYVVAICQTGCRQVENKTRPNRYSATVAWRNHLPMKREVFL